MLDLKSKKKDPRIIESGIEFPDYPEITDIDTNQTFLERMKDLPGNLQVFFTRSDFGKAEVIDRLNKGNEKYGGVFVDKFNNPIVVYEDQPYYVNKKGLSVTDFGNFVSELTKFMPATKAVGALKTLSKIPVGLGLYGATEIAAEGIDAMLAPETQAAQDKTLGESLEQAGKVGAISTAVDVLLPPTFSLLGRGIKAGTKKGLDVAKFVFPRYRPGIEKVQGQTILKEADVVGERVAKEEIPLTKGQRDDDIIQKGREELYRFSSVAGKKANEVIENFDEKQLNIIRDVADGLAEKFGTGKEILQSPTPELDVAKGISEVAQTEAKSLKKQASNLYKKVTNAKDATGQPSVLVNEQSVDDVVTKIIDSAEISALTPEVLKQMPKLNTAINVIKNDLPKAKNLQEIHNIQKSINKLLRNAEKGEAVDIGKIKSAVDEEVFNNLDNAFLIGDTQVINDLQKATSLYKDYIGLTGQAKTKDLAKRKVNSILQKITTENLSPQQVANVLFGHNKLNNPSEMVQVLNKLEAVLPANARDQIMNGLKDGILAKAFMGKDPLKNNVVNRTSIVKNYNAVFNEGKELVERLFTKDELEAIKVFRDKVIPTIAAEQKINPSGTSYMLTTMLADLTEGGLLMNLTKPALSVVGKIGRATPLLESAFKEGQEELYKKEAMDAVNGFLLNIEVNPWISNTTATFLREKIKEEKIGGEKLEGLSIDTDLRPSIASASVDNLKKQQSKPMTIADAPTTPDVNILLQSERAQQAMAQGAKDMGMAPMPPAPMPTAQAPMPSQGGLANLQQAQQFGALFPQDSTGQLIAQGKTNV